MEGHVLGIDLTDNGAVCAWSDSEQVFHVPVSAAVGREDAEWLIGEEAYEAALQNRAVLTDKLLRLFRNDGTATIDGTVYSAGEILGRFLSGLSKYCIAESGGAEPDAVVICLEDTDAAFSASLKEALSGYGFQPETTYVTGRTESFLYYVMSQPREVRTGEVGLFFLDEQALEFYEVKTKRDRTGLYVFADRAALDEAFTLSVFSEPSGAKVADRILMSCADRLMRKKIFTAVFLAGKGFEDLGWASGFMRLVCQRRKVFYDAELFAKGAALRGTILLSGGQDPGFTAVCSGRSAAAISLTADIDGQKEKLPLISPGEPIGGRKVSYLLLPTDRSDLEIRIDALIPGRSKTIRIPMPFLKEREPKTCFIRLTAVFPDERSMRIRIAEEAVGELHSKGDGLVEQEVTLWE